ncbi:hypothetical protein L861_17635 [Litchfieldella anticariensis FP35 = DSM 16096]|uniref:diguanylate cyclase n=1 Tax=Litchfieldella anticariensis (strain DSM 16096 / CECT 5854 / CIP 108499 / LMG 22089 / FP35) TaxID=1121939 RepID=S2L6H6_LITA3|nr:diguanylate cyclase [Halomonas anticariensis]EPC03364.1 hypothetical protein L861_17635 [Halomonas anticariensis FP35 = DSM 16096]
MKSAFSSLRNRFLLALAGVLCLALLALVLVARYQIAPILLEDENRYASAELDRAVRALDSETGHLKRLVEDWAWWDDSYEFVRGERPEYIDSNLYGDTLETLDLNLMVYFSSDNQPYWIAGFNDDDEFTSCSGKQPPCNWAINIVSLLKSKIEGGLEEDTHTWWLTTPELSMIGMSPIYLHDDDVPPSGWLAMVRPLSAEWIEQILNTTGIDMTFSGKDVGGELMSDSLERLSPTKMQASRYLDALPAGNKLLLEATLPRQRYQASLETFRFALYWTSGVLVVTLIVVLVLLERMILRPLRQFARFTQQLQNQSNTSVTPVGLLTRHDEIGILAREFQHLREHQQRQQSLLLELSQHDHLTGLANRRLFDERLSQALDEAQWERGSVATLMVDVDYFKAYNDHYGHQAGDECLVALAKCMDRCFSGPDQLVARTGGEEFSVLLPRMSLSTATEHAETLRMAVERLALPHVASSVASSVTVSIGVAAVTPGLSRDPVEPSFLMRHADKALYAAKRAGRNCVQHSEVELQR